MACKAFTTPLQSLTTLLGLHSSKPRTTAKSSALKTDCRQCLPGHPSVGRAPGGGGGAGKRPCRRTHAGDSSACRLTALLVPVRAMVNNVLKVLHSLTAPDTSISNLESRVRSSCHTPLRACSFLVVFLALPIKLELPVCSSGQTDSQALKVLSGASG
eukprot:273456-Amphidinium_carterae.1